MAPPEAQRAVLTLLRKGDLARSSSVCTIWLKKYPYDYSLLQLGAQCALLQGDYALVRKYLEPSKEAQEEYSILKYFGGKYGLQFRAFSAMQLHSDDADALFAQLLKENPLSPSALPVGMLDGEKLLTTPSVFLLMQLIPSWDSPDRILYQRLVKLAPQDTFVLEMQATEAKYKQLFDQQVEFLKKASHGKLTKERKKFLAVEIERAEKALAAWKKRQEPTTKKDNMGGGRP